MQERATTPIARERLVTTRELLRFTRTSLFDLHREARAALPRITGQEVTCRNRCSYCCYAKVILDAAQGALIYLHLKAEGQWTAALERRLTEADRQQTALSHADVIAARLPCVFLKEGSFGEGQCKVYPVRPVACAVTFSTDPDPSGCAVPGGMNLKHVKNDRANEAFAALHDSVLRWMGQRRRWLFTLPGAVLVAHALIEKLPPPAIYGIDSDQIPQHVPIEDAFDQHATRQEVDR